MWRFSIRMVWERIRCMCGLMKQLFGTDRQMNTAQGEIYDPTYIGTPPPFFSSQAIPSLLPIHTSHILNPQPTPTKTHKLCPLPPSLPSFLTPTFPTQLLIPSSPPNQTLLQPQGPSSKASPSPSPSPSPSASPQKNHSTSHKPDPSHSTYHTCERAI